jgi:hypothetical protein
MHDAEMLHDRGCVRPERVAIADVERLMVHRDPVGTHEPDSLRQRRLIDIRQRQARTTLSETKRERAPDPRAGAGDHRDLVTERTHDLLRCDSVERSLRRRPTS